MFALSVLIGVLSGAFSSFIGGGAGMIAVPFLMFLGFSPYSAVSTPKLGALGIAIGSLTKFSKTGFIQWQFIPVFLCIAVLAGVVGANTLLSTPDFIVKNVVAVLLLITAVTLYTKKELGVISKVTSKIKQIFGYVFYFLMEALRAAFGSGFGTLTGVVLMYFFGLTMLQANATKRLAGFVVTLIATIVYLSKGIIDIQVGLGLFVGMLIGGFIGTHLAIKVGDRWLKYIFTVFAVVMTVLIFSGVNITIF